MKKHFLVSYVAVLRFCPAFYFGMTGTVIDMIFEPAVLTLLLSYKISPCFKMEFEKVFLICRWRDVKLRAFDNAKHRTYVDLKVLSLLCYLIENL